MVQYQTTYCLIASAEKQRTILFPAAPHSARVILKSSTMTGGCGGTPRDTQNIARVRHDHSIATRRKGRKAGESFPKRNTQL